MVDQARTIDAGAWSPRPQHIGIVACSAEGASLCYRTICSEGAALLGAHAHPEVSIAGKKHLRKPFIETQC